MFRIQPAITSLALVLAAGCSVGSGSHARISALREASSAPRAGTPPAAAALAAPAQLGSQLRAVNRAIYSEQLVSFRYVVESLGERLEIHRVSAADVGRTLVWDLQESAYAPAARAEGPAEAIRVVLYAIDSTTGLPAAPLVEIGTIDMYPQNAMISGPQSKLTMRYVVSGRGADQTTYADFTGVDGGRECSHCARVAGWLTDGTTRVEFAASYAVVAGAVRFTATERVASQPGVLRLDATLEDSSMHSAARFMFHGDSLESRALLIRGDDGTDDGTFAVRLNGRPFLDADRDLITIMGPQNRALTPDEDVATRQLYALTYGLVEYVEMPAFLTFNCGCAQ